MTSFYVSFEEEGAKLESVKEVKMLLEKLSITGEPAYTEPAFNEIPDLTTKSQTFVWNNANANLIVFSEQSLIKSPDLTKKKVNLIIFEEQNKRI